MFKVGEGLRGVDIVGVFNNTDDIMDFVKRNPMATNGKYVLLEVGSGDETTRDVLNRLGVKGSYTGADYLHDAVEMAMNDPNCVDLITKLVYPEIARRYNTTSTRVERAIRVAIEGTWDIGDLVYRKKIFGDIGDSGMPRPTNLTYIRSVAQYLK